MAYDLLDYKKGGDSIKPRKADQIDLQFCNFTFGNFENNDAEDLLVLMLAAMANDGLIIIKESVD